MWLFTSCGFFSVVQKEGTTHLTIRARASGDLDRLRTQFMPSLSPTVAGAGTDYPFRATISREDFADGMGRLGEAIHYSNFKDEVAKRMGKERAKIYARVWSVMREIEDSAAPCPPGVLAYDPMEKLPRGGSAGAVVIDGHGRVLLREPKGHYAGYVWTFPKGKPDAGETAVQTALRELKEETGVTGKILARLPGTFRGQTGATVFYLAAMVESGGPLDSETSSIRWATEAEAKLLIAETTDSLGRKRDLDVLAVALNAWGGR